MGLRNLTRSKIVKLLVLHASLFGNIILFNNCSNFSSSFGTVPTTSIAASAQSGAPVISSFTASQASISLGSTSTLSWTTSGATTLSLSADVGTSTGTVTGTSITVTPSATTNYILSATNSAGTVTAKATVTVTSSFTNPTTSTGSPLVLYTDIASGPNSGGENNKGVYLSIFGKNFGSSLSNVKVYINNVEVDNYRYLGTSKGRSDIQQLTVQIGALGSPTPGALLPIKVVVAGVASNTDKNFIVNPGNIYFVSLTGADTNNGSFTSPYRHVQNDAINNNGSGCAISAGMQPIATAGVWGLVQPGDFIIMRGGTWTDNGGWSSQGYAYFLVTQNKSGTAPTGATGSGPITVMGYPTEDVFIDKPYNSAAYGGGIRSADSARQGYGCGAWITIADVRIESGGNEGVITAEAGSLNPNGSHWRVVNNELTAATAVNNVGAKGAGVAGNGAGQFFVGNDIHDIYCGPDDGTSPLQNHGFYFDSTGDYEVAYNHLYNIRGGNGISLYASGSNGPGNVDNVNFHHNLIHNVGKHAINIADGSRANIVVSNNVVYDIDQAGIRFNTTDLTGAKFYNNSFLNINTIVKTYPVATVSNDWGLPNGSMDMRNNIFVPTATSYFMGGSVGFTGAEGTFTNNIWFGSNIQGTNPAASFSKQSFSTDPKFTSTVSGAEDLHLQTGSPGIDSGSNIVSPFVLTDFDLATRPQGLGFDIGAYER